MSDRLTEMRQQRDELEARRLLGGSPVALLSVRWRDEVNILPVAWHMTLSVEPPLLGVAIHPARYSHDMIKASEEFALSIPGPRLLDHVHYFGIVSGAEINKLEASRLSTFPSRRGGPPLLEHCVGWIECGLEDAVAFGDHTLFVGRVVAVQVDDEAFGDTWSLEAEDKRPLHYLGGMNYAALGELLIAKVKTTREGALDQPPPAEDEDPDDVERREEEQQTREREHSEAAEKEAEGVTEEGSPPQTTP